MVDTSAATAWAAWELWNSQEISSWVLGAAQQVLCNRLGGNCCCCGVCQGTGRERQVALSGYEFPRSLTSSPSADAGYKRRRSSCQLPSPCSSPSATQAQGLVNTPLSSLCPTVEGTGATGAVSNFAALAMPMGLP